MRTKPTDEEIESYLRRVAGLEKHVVLPARFAVILSCVLLLWPIITADMGAQNLGPLLRWATGSYAVLSLLSWLYLFRIAQNLKSMALTKAVVFASTLTDNAFLGVLLYALTMRGPGPANLAAGSETSLFGVYCVLLLRNVFLFPSATIQTLVNFLCILSYVSAILFSLWIPQLPPPTNTVPSENTAADTAIAEPSPLTDLPETAKRDLLSRVVILCLVSVCSSAIYALRQRQLRELDEAHEKTIRSLRLDIAGMLAAQVAHELKNPLSIMTNAAFLLRRSSARLDTRATEQLEIIEDEIKRSASIITELLDYAKLAEGTIQRVLVNEALDEALSALKHEVSSRGVEVKKNYSLDLPFLFIDPSQLRQVFINLLLNGCEAIAREGAISISTSYSRDGFIEVSISDTGTGMPAEVAANIFKPFYTTKDKGTGMGLAIVQNVVRAYRGQLRVESTPGVGTTFHLRFPTRMAMLKEKPRTPSRSQAPSSHSTAVPTVRAT